MGKNIEFDLTANYVEASALFETAEDQLRNLSIKLIGFAFLLISLIGLVAVCFRCCLCLIILVPLTFYAALNLMLISLTKERANIFVQ